MFRIRIDLLHICIQFRIQSFDNQKLKKKITLQLKNLFIFLGSKIAIYVSLGLHKGRPSYKRNLQPSKENIHQLKTWNFFTFLSVLRIRDVYPGSRILIFTHPGSRIPDPKTEKQKIGVKKNLLS